MSREAVGRKCHRARRAAGRTPLAQAPRLWGSPWEDASCGVGPSSGGEAGQGGPQGGSAGGGRAPRGHQGQGAEQQEEGDLGVERDREAQRLRQRPAAHPTEAYREPWPPRARGSDSLHAPRPPAPVQPHAAAAGLRQGADACSGGGGRRRPTAECVAAVRAGGPRIWDGRGIQQHQWQRSGAPGGPAGPPPAPDAGAAAAGAGLHWDPEPARWELRSHSAPPGASAACSPPNSRKVRFVFSTFWRHVRKNDHANAWLAASQGSTSMQRAGDCTWHRSVF